MTSRGKIWRVGLILWIALVCVLMNLDWEREVRIIAALLLLAVCALSAEVTGFRELFRGHHRASIPRNAVPADGVVDRVAISGIESVACPLAPLFSNFEGFTEGDRSAFPANHQDEGERPLLGKVALISVFVGRNRLRWSDPEIANGLEAIERAGAWLEREAMRWNAPANVSLADVYFEIEDDVDEPVEISLGMESHSIGLMERDSSTKALIMATRLARRLGFSDVVDWMGRIEDRIDTDAKAWLFHLREAGRSFAITADSSGLPGVGFAVCYAREANYPEPLAGKGRVDPTTVAHELLHLFGASDKYGIGLRAFSPGTVSSKEVMRLSHGSLSRLRIDRLTAIEIGWVRPEELTSAIKSPAAEPFQARRRAK